MRGASTAVEEHIRDLPEERRESIRKLRDLLRRWIPKGYEESILFGTIAWSIPLEQYSETYNGQPLCYAALGSRKSHMALHLMGPYGDTALRRKLEEGFRRAGKKLDMGKSCLRFRSVEDLPLDVIGDVVAALPPEKYIALYERSRAGTAGGKRAGRGKSSRSSRVGSSR